MSKRAVLYARVSGDDSDKEGRNLQGQIEMAREYCATRGYIIAAELSEDVKGASGADIDLPKLNRVREMAAAGEFDVLVVRELDRLSRNLGKQLVVEEELKRSSANIEYVLYDYPDTPEGNLMKHIRASFAEFERAKITERNVRGRRLKVKGGSVLCYGHAPYGYRIEKTDKGYVLVVYDPEAKIVRLVFYWFVSERRAINQIVRELNTLGVPLHEKPIFRKNEKRSWSDTTVRCILKNETYAGTWHFGKRDKHGMARPREQWISATAPAIVSYDDFEAAQSILTSNSANHAYFSKYDYLMSRHLTCGKCNTTMAGRTLNQSHKDKFYRYRYYFCKHLQQMRGHNVNANKVDTAIWGWLKSLLLDPACLREGVKAYIEQQEASAAPIRQQLEVTQSLLTEKRREYHDLLELYLSSKIRKDILDTKAQSLDTEITSLEQTERELLYRLESATLTAERIADLEGFAADLRKKLDYAENEFAKRRWLVETLDATATFRVIEGVQVLDAQCVIGAKSLVVSTTTTRPSGS